MWTAENRFHLPAKKQKILKLSVEELPLIICVLLQGMCFEFIPICIPFTQIIHRQESYMVKTKMLL